MKKRAISIIMTVCMAVTLLAALPSGMTVQAATPVSMARLEIAKVEAGTTPATVETAKITNKNASTYVKSVRWTGWFDHKGNFREGKVYTVYIGLGIRDGVNRVFTGNHAKVDVTINGKKAKVVKLQKDYLEVSRTIQATYLPDGVRDPEAYFTEEEADERDLTDMEDGATFVTGSGDVDDLRKNFQGTYFKNERGGFIVPD